MVQIPPPQPFREFITDLSYGLSHYYRSERILMINWMYFPKNKTPDIVSNKIVEAFSSVAPNIDSYTYRYSSNDVLAIARPYLEKIGFDVEKNKKSQGKVTVPVLYGLNGRIEKSFDADGYYKESGYVVEVEAGRGVINYQFLKDFFEACTMADVNYLCIAVRNIYESGNLRSNDFERVCRFFEALYASNRLEVPLSGILIIGY